ncbi:MAG: 4Fe-4S binding protein [Nitrospirota bacterium]|nr:MAG: 4Fe-4S binding protein [Nitrospirota bacterium]
MRKVRHATQAFFLFLTVLTGYRFYLFMSQFGSDTAEFVTRPPSVDAFMPIAGFMSLKYFIFTGIIEPIHPAAFIMFLAIVTVSLVAKKGFCGWICPIGTISQYFWMAGEKLFGKNFIMSKQYDIPVRSLKYLLMGMFILLIGVAMTPNMMVLFFITDYYKTIDVRTMQVFTQMSTLTLIVLLVIGAFSLFYKNFWCRYLCPYGALLGLVSSASPAKIKRDNDKCIDCKACTKACPSAIEVSEQDIVHSPECLGCTTCLSHCPEEGALEMTVRAGKDRKPFKPVLFPIALIVSFYLIIGIGVLTENWHSKMHPEEYERVITDIGKEHSESGQ